MTTEEAIRRLDEMQSQIIHGKRTFGEIADVIRNQELVRRAALSEVADALENIHGSPALLLAHRILSTNYADGIGSAAVENRCSDQVQSSPNT